MTGQLKGSINARATEEGAEVGTNLVYAATHQFGASGRVIRAKNKPYLAFEYHGRTIRKKQVTVNIPARPFLGISDEDRQEIKSLVEEALSEEGVPGGCTESWRPDEEHIHQPKAAETRCGHTIRRSSADQRHTGTSDI